MLKRSTLSLTLILTMAWSLSAFQGGEWIKVAPAGSGFSVMMPGTPKEEKRVQGDYSSQSFSVSTDISIFFAEYGDYGASRKVNPAEELAANRDNFVKGIEGTLLESKEISLDGHPGLEFSATSARFSAKCRIYVSGNRVYMLATGVMKSQDDSANVNRFLTSFAFIKSDSVQKP